MVAVFEVLTPFWLKLAKRHRYLANDLTEIEFDIGPESPISKFIGLLIGT